MDTNTGHIGWFESEELAKRAGYDLQLTQQEATELLPLPPNQRLEQVQSISKRWRSSSKKGRRAA